MMTLRVGACLALLATAASAQDMAANKAKKLAEPWLKNAAWFTDYDEALKAAAASNKMVFGYFTRSYAP